MVIHYKNEAFEGVAHMNKMRIMRGLAFLLALIMIAGNFVATVAAEDLAAETEPTIAESSQNIMEESNDSLENSADSEAAVFSEDVAVAEDLGQPETAVQPETAEEKTTVGSVDDGTEALADPEALIEQPVSKQDVEESEYIEESDQPNATSEAEKPEAGSMPAFSARNTAGNGVTVSVSAEEGVFPDGTTMVVTAASKEVVIEAAQAITLRKVVDAAAVNISFYNEQGKEIEPADHSKVHVTLQATDGSVDGRDFLVVHVNDNMAAEQVTDIVGLTGGEATFYANEFSIYAIIGTDPSDDGEALERITYKIYDKEDGNLLSTQIVKTGDTLAEPQLPDPEKGQTFLGWYIKSDGAYERFNGFGVVIRVEDTNSDTVVNVFPRYGELYTVCFHDVTQDDVIVGTISGEYVEGNTEVSLTEINKRTVDVGADSMCTGWALTKEDAQNLNKLTENLEILSAGSIDLYPVIEDGHSLLFDVNDSSVNRASIVTPQYLYPGDVTVAPENPVRIGYQFLGWNTAKDGSGSKFEFGNELTKNTTIYAQWEAQEVTYNIIYWTEILSNGPTGTHDAVDENGNFDESKAIWSRYGVGTDQALTGSTAKVLEADSMPGNISVPQYYKFYKSAEKEVAGDGSTEINVYFRLKTYEFRWEWDNYSAPDGTVEFYIKTGIGDIYADAQGHGSYTINAVLGESVANKTPVLEVRGDNLNPEALCYGWACPRKLIYGFYTNQARSSIPYYWIDEMQLGGSFTAIYSRSMVNMQFNSWAESAEEDNVYVLRGTDDRVRAQNTTYLPSNTTKYMVYAVVPGDVRNPTKPGESYPDVVQQNVTIDGKEYALVYNWYYMRRRFDLIFKDQEGSANYVANYKDLSSQSPIKCDAPIADYYKVPEKEGYDFLGWYDIEGNQVTDENGILLPAYENEVMPALNTVREAHWKKSGTVTVTFDPNGGSFADDTTADKAFEKIKDTLFPTQDIPELNDRAGYMFDRWVYADGTEAGKPFDFAHTQLIRDVNLKARWISMASVQVEYDAKEHGTFLDGSKLYDDSEKHLDGTGVILRGAPEKVDEGYYFIGWQMTDSPAIYKAGSAVSIVADSNDKCIFTAVYDKTPIDARLTYHSNYPESTGKENSETTVIKANNSGLNIAAAEDVAFSLKGYTFQGWSELSDGTVKYQPGKEAGIDNRSENDLYAIWAVNRYKLTVDPNGGTWGGTEETTEYIMDYQETKDIEDPTWEGYTFAGWTLTPADSESVLQNRVFTMGVKDTVLTAQWQKVTLEKETISTPADGVAYAFGETICYRISVTADGTVATPNITVYDELTNDAFTLQNLQVGETKSFETSYVVNEADILAGKVVNVATARAGNVPVDPAQTEDPTEKPTASLYVRKTSDAVGPVKGGQIITYTIEVLNNGNQTITEIQVIDPLTGDLWEIQKLIPGEHKEYQTTHQVTAQEFETGYVTNTVIAAGQDPDGNKVSAYDSVTDRMAPVLEPGDSTQKKTPLAHRRAVATSNVPATGDSNLICHYTLISGAALLVAVAAFRKRKTH